MSDSKAMPTSGCFPTTEWTRVITVIQQGDESAAFKALGEFCERYRPAIRNFFRRRGCSEDQAEDYTQAFFETRIVTRWAKRDGPLHIVQRDGQGLFRCFLCHVLWRFLQDEWKKQLAARAGGGVTHVPLDDLQLAEGDGEQEGFNKFGREFDREFAREIIRKAAERSRHSQYLLAHLRGEMSQEEAAGHLGLTANAFKQAYHRFRQRLAQDLWEEVSKLAGPGEKEIRAEIRYLMSLFAESPP